MPRRPPPPSTKEDGPLRRYRDKRDPSRTNEPFAPDPPRRGPTRRGAFVVHQHAATRMHWDLRLEMGGALESFAVPKGPSLLPAEKRLAVHTEPHPLEYLDFEAVIPEGNYGAGAMIVWDRGVVEYPEAPAEEGLAAGKVDFVLSGAKLRGRFALVRTSGRRADDRGDGGAQWLLLKKRDAHARSDGDVAVDEPESVLSGLRVDELRDLQSVAASLLEDARGRGAGVGEVDGRALVPMLAVADAAPPSGPGWLFELKLDGVRLLADRRGDEVVLTYRSGRVATASFPEVARAVRALPVERLVLDGELVTFDEAGRPSFQRLASRLHAERGLERRLAREAIPVRYVVFDLLQLGPYDLRPLPLRDRKALLARLVRGKGLVRALDHLEGDGGPLLAFCRDNRLEGIVAKRAASPYRPGPGRGGDWVKIKCERDEDFVVLGWTPGDGARARLGALVVGSHEEDAEGRTRLVERGRAGTGFDERAIDAVLARLAPLALTPEEAAAAPVALRPGVRTRKGVRPVRLVRPSLVARVRFAGWTDDGALRAPVFLGLRDDVDPAACRAAPPPPDAPLDEPPDERPGAAAPAPAPAPPAASPGPARARRVQLTNQQKVFWPGTGQTKGDLCRYYEAVAPAMLPYLADRPVVLVRYPDGVEGKHFYQWNTPRGTPAWVRTFRLPDDDGDDKQTFLVDDVDTLLHVANLGAIPIHVLAFRAATPDRCDFLTIDLDVSGASFREAVTLARSLREILDAIGLPGFPKTSGQSGLHVLVPLGPGAGFDAARALADLLGQLLVRRHPDIATMERLKRRRGARVLVDTGQTGRGRTIVAPWSVRAAPGAPVSTPLDWDEVSHALVPSRLTMETVLDRLAERGDPMAPLRAARPDLPAAATALGALLGR